MSFETFTNAYVECLMWSEYHYATEEDFSEGIATPFDEVDAILSRSAIEWIEMDCRSFYDDCASLWSGLWTDEQAGHDFCLTRNGHGAGFWDRSYGGDALDTVGAILTERCRPYGTMSLGIDQNGQICTE